MRRRTLVSLAAGAALLIGSAGAAQHGMARHATDFSGTLTVYDWGSLSGFASGKAAVAAYEKLHPGVTVKLLPQNADPTTYIQQALQAGTAPDVLMPSFTPETYQGIAQQYWLDLTPYTQQPDPYVPGNKHWADLIDPVDLKANSLFGTTSYVFSWTKQDAAFFYNKDAFAKAGIVRPPTTWAEFMADQALLKKAGYIPSFFALGEPYPVAENGTFVSLIENQVMSRTFKQLDVNHDGQVDVKELLSGIKHHIYSPSNPDYQEAWKLMKEWSQYWEPDAASQKNPPNQLSQGWAQGKIAIYYAGQYALGYIPPAKLQFKWGLFHFPWVTKASSAFASPTPPGYGIWGAWNADSWGIPTTTKTRGHLQLALDFINYITAPKQAIPIALNNGFTPVIKGYMPTGPIQRFFGDILQHPVMQGAAEATLGEQFLRDRIGVMQGYITGVYSLDQAMQQMQAALNRAATKTAKNLGITIT
jgi:ABC-type glycerol-3-phosphate transport system substrate-binding protein